MKKTIFMGNRLNQKDVILGNLIYGFPDDYDPGNYDL